MTPERAQRFLGLWEEAAKKARFYADFALRMYPHPDDETLEDKLRWADEARAAMRRESRARAHVMEALRRVADVTRGDLSRGLPADWKWQGDAAIYGLCVVELDGERLCVGSVSIPVKVAEALIARRDIKEKLRPLGELVEKMRAGLTPREREVLDLREASGPSPTREQTEKLMNTALRRLKKESE